jgi:hypothetical protein
METVWAAASSQFSWPRPERQEDADEYGLVPVGRPWALGVPLSPIANVRSVVSSLLGLDRGDRGRHGSFWICSDCFG